MTTPTDEVRQTITHALEMARGDDLSRAEAAFRNYTPAKMAEPWTGTVTRQQLLDRYRAHAERHDRALAWLKEQA